MNFRILTMVVLLFTAGCFPGGFFTQKKDGDERKDSSTRSVETTETDGVTTGRIDADSSQVQRMSVGGELNGSYAEFPSGALAVTTDVSIQEGADLNDANLLEELGLDASAVTTGGKALVVSPSVETDTQKPFTLAVTLNSQSTLTTQSGSLAILFKSYRYSEGGKLYVGIIPPSEVTSSGGAAVFKTSYWGSYQPIYTTLDVSKVEPKVTDSQIVAKNDVGSLSDDEIGYAGATLNSGQKYYWAVEALDKDGKVVITSEQWEFKTK